MAGKKADIFAIAIIILSVAFWFLVVQEKYYGFSFGSGDTAVAEQAIWNTTHGNWFQQSSLLTTESNFREHLNFIQFVYLPFYWIFPHTFTLYFVIYFFYGIAGIILYFFVKKKVSLTCAIIALLLFLFQPITIIQTIGPMHVVALAAPLLLLTLIEYEKKRYKNWLILLALTALVSEFIAPTVFLIGVIAFLERRKLKWIFPPIIFSGAMYAFSSYFITLGLSEHGEIIKKFKLQNICETLTKKRVKFAEIAFFRPIFYFIAFFSRYSILLIPSVLLALFIAIRIRTGAHIFSPVPAITVMIFIDVVSRANQKYRKIIYILTLIGLLASSSLWISYMDLSESKTKDSLATAVSLVKDNGSVTALRQASYHLSRRSEFYLPDNGQLTDYVIFKSGKKPNAYKTRIKDSAEYTLVMNKDQVCVFIKKQKLSELLNMPADKLPDSSDEIFRLLFE